MTNPLEENIHKIKNLLEKISLNQTDNLNLSEDKKTLNNLKKILRARFSSNSGKSSPPKLEKIIQIKNKNDNYKTRQYLHSLDFGYQLSIEEILQKIGCQEINLFEANFQILPKIFYEFLAIHKNNLPENNTWEKLNHIDLINLNILNSNIMKWSLQEIAIFEFLIISIGKDFNQFTKYVFYNKVKK